MLASWMLVKFRPPAWAIGIWLQNLLPSQEGAKAISTVGCLALGLLSARIERWGEWAVRAFKRRYCLQFATNPHRFHRVISSHAKSWISQNTARRNIYLAINMRNTSGAEPMQILLEVFSHSQEGRGTASDTGLKGTESAFQVLQIQYADKCHSALRVVRPCDWFTLIDLKDPYFHISIYPLHIKFMQLVIQGGCTRNPTFLTQWVSLAAVTARKVFPLQRDLVSQARGGNRITPPGLPRPVG